MFAVRAGAGTLVKVPQLTARGIATVRSNLVSRVKPTSQITKRNLWEIAKDEEGYMAYRKMMPPSKVDQRCAAMVGAVFWAWLTWNFITEFGHISGADFPWVDPASFSNAELGIPADE